MTGFLKRTIISLLLLGTFAVGSGSLVAVTATPDALANDRCNTGFFGLPAWYRGLTTTDGRCDIANPEDVGGLSSFIWTIALNVIQALLMIVGYMSAVFLIIGGFRYITAAGSADQIKAAKDTIRNAIIGMVISLSAVAIVNAIVGAILP